MKNLKVLSILGLTLTLGFGSSAAFGYGMGISTFPLEAEKKVLSAEVTGIVSNGSGLGLQARYTQKINEFSAVDAGLGIAGGERSARLFAGYDYELFPDYENQPRTSIKAFLENSKEFGTRRNILGLAPTVSKGFSFWGQEAFPYLSLPYGISLDGTKNSYQTTISANLGITGIIPAEQIGSSRAITANAEVIVGLKDSFSAVFVGLGYPIE
ncbi:MAG: hypothetical protein HOP07_03925 [Bacteriovoracaceae bacterium]|nr:hypothetical protein [Bacteriovoracaceae bacterium]